MYTAEKDTAVGMGSGWERFEFDKDAPLDDEEIEGQYTHTLYCMKTFSEEYVAFCVCSLHIVMLMADN